MSTAYLYRETKRSSYEKPYNELHCFSKRVNEKMMLESGEIQQVKKIFQNVVGNIINPELVGTLYLAIAYMVKQLSYDAPIDIRPILDLFHIKINVQEFKKMQILLLDQIDFELY